MCLGKPLSSLLPFPATKPASPGPEVPTSQLLAWFLLVLRVILPPHQTLPMGLLLLTYGFGGFLLCCCSHPWAIVTPPASSLVSSFLKVFSTALGTPSGNPGLASSTGGGEESANLCPGLPSTCLGTLYRT